MDVVTEKTIMMIFTNYDGTTDDKGFAAAEYNSYKLLFLNQNRTWNEMYQSKWTQIMLNGWFISNSIR